ncbi:MAG: DUF721 domain-containing protein [Bacteroidales bacterium]|jgi:predicted nucleic acid-binding Zn ribbon protein|nr:DUF721 domain-containing protein [Bacteroidales bacterium]OPZ96326.1 MAG: hypothetical protein BWY72_01703 [Bacteroidetes bacterium ADurb.Bin416]HBL72663.1 hypothetical protein [Bacteroidales bacterium]
MIRRNAQKLGDVLEELLRLQQLDGRLYEKRLIKCFPEVVGQALAAHVTQLFITKGVLHITVNAAVIRQEMQLMRSRLIEQLNKAIGREVIQDIRLH